jgi:hypothetical protein
MEKTISEIIHMNKHVNRKKYIDSLTHDKELLKKLKLNMTSDQNKIHKLL